MRIFLDTEFTGLHQKTTLISLALVAEDGRELYAEFIDFDKGQLNPWLSEHVLGNLDKELQGRDRVLTDQCLKIRGTTSEVVVEMKLWLSQFESIEIWADVLAYDWVLFCELFGGAMNIPSNIFYAPFDLATCFRLAGFIEPKGAYERDISRFEFAGVDKAMQHNALADARVELMCFRKLQQMK